MKVVVVLVCCAWLSGCAYGGLAESSRIDPMASDGQTYVPGIASSAEPPGTEDRITSTCTMRGQNVVCR